MSSLASLRELVGFFSYSREDDEAFKGSLSALRDGIQRELSAQLGRSKRNFRLWQDQEAIAPGKLWEAEIKAAVAQAVFFIPIITPRTAASNYCQFEFDAFLARERALGRTDLIFPILYISVPGLDDETRWRGHGVLSVIGERQYVDWRHLRHLGSDTTVVRETIERFCQKIVEALNEPWLSPEERLVQEEQERQDAQARQSEQLAREAAARADDEKRRKEAEGARKAAAAEAERKAAAAEAARQTDADSTTKAQVAARMKPEAEARQNAEQVRTAAPAAVAMNISSAETSQPTRGAPPQPSSGLIWALGGLLATSLLVEPVLLRLPDASYLADQNSGLKFGLTFGAINCVIAAVLVFFWQRLRRVVLGLYIFGMLENGLLTLPLVNLLFPSYLPALKLEVAMAAISLFYFVVCVATLVVLWRARPSRASRKDQATPAAERLKPAPIAGENS